MKTSRTRLPELPTPNQISWPSDLRRKGKMPIKTNASDRCQVCSFHIISKRKQFHHATINHGGGRQRQGGRARRKHAAETRTGATGDTSLLTCRHTPRPQRCEPRYHMQQLRAAERGAWPLRYPLTGAQVAV